jgi:hypothetical protein
MGICGLQGYIYNFDFNADPDLAFHSNADPVKRNRIPKIMRIREKDPDSKNHADPDVEKGW